MADAIRKGMLVTISLVMADMTGRTLEETPQRSIRHHRFSNDRHKSGFAPLAQQMPTWVKEGKVFFSKQEKK